MLLYFWFISKQIVIGSISTKLFKNSLFKLGSEILIATLPNYRGVKSKKHLMIDREIKIDREKERCLLLSGDLFSELRGLSSQWLHCWIVEISSKTVKERGEIRVPIYNLSTLSRYFGKRNELFVEEKSSNPYPLR